MPTLAFTVQESDVLETLNDLGTNEFHSIEDIMDHHNNEFTTRTKGSIVSTLTTLKGAKFVLSPQISRYQIHGILWKLSDRGKKAVEENFKGLTLEELDN